MTNFYDRNFKEVSGNDVTISSDNKTQYKYKLTKNYIYNTGVKLYQIEALIDIDNANVKAGDLGGYIQGYQNLSNDIDDGSWVTENAIVYGNAFIHGNAIIYGNAEISGNSDISGDLLIYGDTVISDDVKISGVGEIYC